MNAHVARFVDIHALHTVPYANLNRDDLGTPKTVYYGGGVRTRWRASVGSAPSGSPWKTS